MCPDFAKRWTSEKNEQAQSFGVPHEVLLARKGETPPGLVVIDTACNRSMVGELTMKADREDIRKNHNMDLRLVPSQERFSFGGGSHKGQDVAENVIRPIGIEGFSGEGNFSVSSQDRMPPICGPNWTRRRWAWGWISLMTQLSGSGLLVIAGFRYHHARRGTMW